MNIRAVEHKATDESFGFCGRMELAFVRTWVEQDRLVLGTSEVVRAMPTIDDKFVLWRIVQPSDHRLLLYPDQHLRHLESGINHAVAERPDHLVGIENVRTVFLRKVWHDRFEPLFAELTVFRVGLQVVVRNLLVLRERAKVVLGFHHRDTVGRVRTDESDALITKKRLEELWVAAVTLSETMIAKLPDSAIS